MPMQIGKPILLKADANAEIVNTDGKNGGFKGSTVVSE